MKHTIKTKDAEGNILYIKIRLDDECKNGHQDFAITCKAYPKKGKRVYNNGGDNCIYCGCCHDEILKVRPDLKIFVDLHLSDYTGAPMYAIKNGRYHMKDKRVAMEYLRITESEYNTLNENKETALIFGYTLINLGITKRWREEANKAIELLEEMTGEKFVNTSTKTQFVFTQDQYEEAKKLVESGHFEKEKVEQRRKEEEDRIYNKAIIEVLEQCEKEKEKAELNKKVKLQVLQNGLTLENFIFYDHTKEGVFNWKGYGTQTTPEQFQKFMASITPIEGVTYRLKNS